MYIFHIFSVLTFFNKIIGRSLLAENAQILAVNENDFIYKRGENGNTFFIIISGEIENVISGIGNSDEFHAEILKNNEIFGESCLINNNSPRTTTAMASK